MDGILNINKPWGKTSFGVVAMVKRLTGEKRVGHAGTLDPAATGVLPVCLGRATRIVEFLMDATKTYSAQIELGVTTDTYDAAGKIIQQKDPANISRKKLEAALNSFRGLIQQTPPMYSAVKHHGQPLYELARAGLKVERKSRPAKIHRLEIIGWQPPVVTIEVECSKGTYIRSLAHDLGQSLGCGASLKNLVRLKCGIFDIENAVSLPQLEDAFHHGYWQRFLYPMDSVLQEWRAIIVSNATEDAIKKGVSVDLSHTSSNEKTEQLEQYCRAYNLDGRFIAVLRLVPETGQWHPEKVFVQSPP